MPIFSAIDPSKIANHSNTVVSAKIAMPPKAVVSEPVDRRPAVRKVTGRQAFSTPSILDALREDAGSEHEDEVLEGPENQDIKNEIDQPFSQQELLEAWRNFVGKIDLPQLKSALSAREPKLTEAWQIEYELDTELQYNRLTLDLKPKLIGYLRNLFRNEAVDIQFKVSESTDNKSHIPYTDAERWSSLVEKYPALAALKSKFGLDFEHF